MLAPAPKILFPVQATSKRRPLATPGEPRSLSMAAKKGPFWRVKRGQRLGYALAFSRAEESAASAALVYFGLFFELRPPRC